MISFSELGFFIWLLLKGIGDNVSFLIVTRCCLFNCSVANNSCRLNLKRGEYQMKRFLVGLAGSRIRSKTK